MGLNIYKSKLQAVQNLNEVPKEVEDYLNWKSNNYQDSAYTSDEDELREDLEEESKEHIEIVLNWYDEHNLFEFDIHIED